MDDAYPSEKLARAIVERLQRAGHVAYFAGGCVRDRVMGREPKDFDVATSARPEEVLKLFPRSQQVGVAFGVILVRERRSELGGPAQVEVATFRTDGVYSDGRHPDKVEFTNAHEDARRRDFTCNGLFFDPLAANGAGALHDYVAGQRDIEAKILRAIGDPVARFREDHLRMLRAVRFAARLEFQIEPETLRAIELQAEQIRTISRERIGEELRMILEHPTRAAAVRLLEKLGLMRHLWPVELPTLPTDTRRRLDDLPEDIGRAVALAALSRDYGSQGGTADQLQESLALSNDERDEIAWLLAKLPVLLDRRQWTRPTTKKLMADPRWPQLQSLYVAERKGAADPDLSAWTAQMSQEGVAPAPFITGDTLIELGAVPNPGFRNWLDSLYNRQLEGELRTPEDALEAARALLRAT